MYAIKSPSARSDERRSDLVRERRPLHININLPGVRDVTVLNLSIDLTNKLTNIPIMSDLLYLHYCFAAA